jgi:hypothetical protein
LSLLNAGKGMAVSDKDPSGAIRPLPLEKVGAPNSLGAGSGGDDGISDMTQRLSRMEGALEGIRHNQTITFSAVALVSAIVIAVSSYSLVRIGALEARFDGLGARFDSRIGTLERRVDELPARISADIRDITSTLSQAITASKQMPPQVIVIPPAAIAPAPKAP